MKILCIRWSVRIVICLMWLGIMSFALYGPRLFMGDEKSITIFTWPQVFDGKMIRKFEKQTGIKVYVSFYEGNQELLRKLESTTYHGYDIIIPSDYMLEQLKEKGLIKTLDESRVAGLKSQILPELMHHYFDVENRYSLPYNWYLYGVGIDGRRFMYNPKPSWGLLFDATIIKDHRLGMTSDPRETIFLAALYLFGEITDMQNPEKIDKIIALLKEQKKWVSVYTDLRLNDVLVSGEASIVMSNGADMMRAERAHSYVQLIIPREGTFMMIDSVAIAAHSTKDDLIYQFLEYIYSPEVLMHHYTLFAACPPIQGMPSFTYQLYQRVAETDAIFFFDNTLHTDQINKIWMEVLAS